MNNVNIGLREIAEEDSFLRLQANPRLALEIRAREIGSHFDYFHLPTMQEAINGLRPVYSEKGWGVSKEKVSRVCTGHNLVSRGIFGLARSNFEEVRDLRKKQIIESWMWGFTRDKAWIKLTIQEEPYFFGDFGINTHITFVLIEETTLKEVCAWSPLTVLNVWRAFTIQTNIWHQKALERLETARKLHTGCQIEDALLHHKWREYEEACKGS